MSEKKFIRRLVLDVLKPHEPPLHVLAQEMIGEFEFVDSVNLTVYEIDQKTQSIKCIIQGQNLDFDALKVFLEQMNCAIHSIDQVIAGQSIIENIPMPQDHF